VTIQKDIADRMLARTGDKNYSSYAIKANLLAEYRSSYKVSRNCFIPKPFVDSVVVEASRKELPGGLDSDEEIEGFFNLVNSSFLHRRKKLLKSLSLKTRYQEKLDIITCLLKDLGKDTLVRAEDLTLEEYIHIYKNLE
jgi:16S rRNA (adenine1518-N6/adenine1519-N6)-dimethyltransferase